MSSSVVVGKIAVKVSGMRARRVYSWRLCPPWVADGAVATAWAMFAGQALRRSRSTHDVRPPPTRLPVGRRVRPVGDAPSGLVSGRRMPMTSVAMLAHVVLDGLDSCPRGEPNMDCLDVFDSHSED